MTTTDAVKTVSDLAHDLTMLLPVADPGNSVAMRRCISDLKQIEVQLGASASAEGRRESLVKQALILATKGLIEFYKGYANENR
jgi:hypothetical protein